MKYITEQELSDKKPIKPKYFRSKVFLSMNVYTIIMVGIITPMFYWFMHHALLNQAFDILMLKMMLGITYFISMLLNLGAVLEGKTICFPFMLWLCGLKKYYNLKTNYENLVEEFEKQYKAKELIKQYKDYEEVDNNPTHWVI